MFDTEILFKVGGELGRAGVNALAAVEVIVIIIIVILLEIAIISITTITIIIIMTFIITIIMIRGDKAVSKGVRLSDSKARRPLLHW